METAPSERSDAPGPDVLAERGTFFTLSSQTSESLL
jgi:hypothetical protein